MRRLYHLFCLTTFTVALLLATGCANTTVFSSDPLSLAATVPASPPAMTATASGVPTPTLPTSPTPAPAATNGTPVDRVDPQRAPAVAGQDPYFYYKVATADFDGDGVDEQAFLVADAIVENGQPLWDDGHVWQVYIEEPTGERTYVYAQFMQLGTVEARTVYTDPTDDQPPYNILLIAQWPDLYAVYEVQYRGPTNVQVVELVQRTFSTSPQWFTSPPPE